LKIGFGGNTEEETFLVLDEPIIIQDKNTRGTCNQRKKMYQGKRRKKKCVRE
jgi:hypothetical protein